MKHMKLFILVCVAIIIAFVVLCLNLNSVHQTPFHEKIQKLELNMPLEKVIENMGRPHETAVIDGELWLSFLNRNLEAMTLITPEGIKGCDVVLTNNFVSKIHVFY